MLNHWHRPRARPYIVAIIVVAVLASLIILKSMAAAYHERAPKMGSECILSHTESYISYEYDFDLERTVPRQRFKTVCDASVPRCFEGGKNYVGPLRCEGDTLVSSLE